MMRFLACAAVALSIAACSTQKKLSAPMTFEDNIVVAHRGAFKKNGFPENSIASLKEAIRLGCTGSEFDVRMTADDSLIINHDPHHHELDIEKSTYAQLIAFPLSNGEKLPTLQEYLLAGLQQNKTRLVLEIKPSGLGKERAKIIAERAWQLVQKLNAAPMVTYISFDYDMLLHIKAKEPNAPLQYLNGEKSPAVVANDGIMGIDYNLSVFKKNPQWIAEAKQHNVVLNAWTVNKKEDMEWLIREGFPLITTNEPEMLLQLTGKAK
ncbi:MAG: glycerophosphodiester phosphodiesterase [Chitinophagaceae bacterium]|nr:MAG: glycerophosphodiester phosphodiesterase [Chitinophagaceae bacterium]